MTIQWDKQIEDDLKWRELELAVLKKQAATYAEGTNQRKALLRALWCLCYAHFEGFTKFCWELLANHVTRQGLLHKQLKPPLLLLAIEDDCRKFRGDTSTARIVQFAQSDFPQLMNSPVSRIPVPDTESNLWAQVYMNGCSMLGIIDTTVDVYSAKVNSLVGKRNAIAHGDSLTVPSLRDYQEHEDAVFIVMHSLAIQVFDAIIGSAFHQS